MENVALLARKRFTMDKFSSELKIQTEESIKSILSIRAASVTSACECTGGFVSVSGKTKVNVIFETEEGKASFAEGILEFSEKQQASFALENCHAIDTAEVTNHSVMGGEILVFVDHEISVCGNYKYEISSFSETEDELVLSKKSFNALKFVSNAEDSFVVAEEVSSNAEGAQVLSCSAKTILSDAVCLVDKIVIQGKIIAEAIYADNTGVCSLNKEFEFKQEIAANGALPNMVPDIHAEVKNVTLTAEEVQEKTNFVFVFDMFAKAFIYDENTYEVVTDLFSLKNELQTSYGYVEMKNYSAVKTFSDTALNVFDVSGFEDFDDIIGVFFPKFKYEATEKLEGKYVVSGKIEAEVFYKSTDSIHSKAVSFDTKIEVLVETADELREIQVLPEISSYKVKAGKDLEIMFGLSCTAKFETSISEKYVSAYDIISEKPENLCGIKVYVTSAGESLFDVARNLNVRPETIESQNEVAETFDQGEKIYIYSPVNLA